MNYFDGDCQTCILRNKRENRCNEKAIEYENIATETKVRA